MTIEEFEILCKVYNQTLQPQVASYMIGKLIDKVSY